MRSLIVFLVLLVGTADAKANMTGNELKGFCSFAPRETEATAMCMGYINGVLDTFREVGHDTGKPLFCEPASVTGPQLISMTKKRLEDYPEQLHFVASSIILEMMTKTFPCEPGK